MKLTPEQESVESRMSMLWPEDWAPLFALLTAENINHRDRMGRAILSQAICSLPVTTEKIRRLIELGADVNAIEKIGFTPLHFAAQEKKLEIAQLLVDHGANVNAQDKHGNTPLGRAT